MELTANRALPLSKLILRDGPQKEEFGLVNHMFSKCYREDREGFAAHFSKLRKEVRAFHSLDSVVGFCYQQPHGYAGDFEMIERLYSNYISEDPVVEKWDAFAQAQPAAKAVRNRKNYFTNLLRTVAPHSVLNVASGPCRDLKEFFGWCPQTEMKVDCIDLDKKAIMYARQLLGEDPRVTFQNRNVLRWQCDKTYDLIWSAGLFDYFTDRIFVKVLGRLLKCLNKGGMLVIGNFSDTNPNRPFMEVAMNWHLYHRSASDLERLAREAGAGHHDLWVGSEKEGVNLFLHIKEARA
jgi:SAM-dependent methyltransferase